MRTLLSHAPGPADSLILAEVPDPVPKAGQVVIRVAACAVNFPDSLIIEDRYQVRPERPFAPGAEAAGVVEAVGEGVSSPKAGERVIVFTSWGAMAEKIAVPASRCIAMPDAMPF